MSNTDALRHLVDDMHTLAHRRGTDNITMPQHLYNDNDRADSQWNTAYVAATRHWVAQLEKALGMTTSTEAIAALISEPIEQGGAASAADFDLDAIVDEVLVYRDIGTARAGFEMAVDTDTFWRVVEKHAR